MELSPIQQLELDDRNKQRNIAAQELDAQNTFEKQREEELAKQQQLEQQQSAQALKTKTDPNKSVGGIAGEVGTAAVGGVIDAVEGVGATAEMAVKGQGMNPDFKPTWLQMDDSKEPMNRTAWGNVLRGVVEFGTLFAATRGAGKAVSMTKVPGLSQVGQFASRTPTTLKGKLVQGAAVGAAVDFTSSFSTGDTLSTELHKMMPWMPDALVTSKDDAPLVRKAKNVMEGIGLGMAADVLLGLRAGKKAAQIAKDSKAVQAVEPTTAMELAAAESKAMREADINATIKRDIERDPVGANGPTPHVNPDFFDMPNKAATGVGSQESLYHNLLDAYRGADNPNSRRVKVFTEAALNDRLTQLDPERRKILKNLEKEIDASDALTSEVNGVQVTGDQLRKLSAARYIDLVDAAGDPEGLEQLQKMLYENSFKRVDQSTGQEIQLLNTENFRAAEMLIHTTAGELSDIAVGTKTIMDTMDTSTQKDMMMNRLEFLLMETGKAKYFRGLDLNQLKNGIAPSPSVRAAKLAEKEAQVKEFTKALNEIWDKDPQMTQAFVDAFAFSNGDVKSIDQLYHYAKDKVFNWKSVIGQEGKKSALVDGVLTNMYNSVLSAPKTIARALLGTNLVTLMRPVQIALGGVLTGESKLVHLGMAQGHSIIEGFGEAWRLAKRTQDAMVHNLDDVPYAGESFIPIMTETPNWQSLGAVIETQGNLGDKAAYRITSMISDFNSHPWVRYPTNTMASIDGFTKTIIGRMELKSKAFEEAWNKTGGTVNGQLVREYEAKLRSKVFNENGEAINEFAKLAGSEASLTRPLTGNLGQFDTLLQKAPIIRPFFMFMKTGINALQLVQKHTPLLARFNDEVGAVLRATPDDLSGVMAYGIDSPAKLMEQKALIKGRVAMGNMTVAAAAGLYTTGSLTGNGPMDVQQRNAWTQAGWKPRSIKIGDRWVSYDGLEPFASFLAVVADVGDNSQNLGSAWSEDAFQKLGYVISMNLTNKSFLAGLSPFVEVLNGNPNRVATTSGNIINNFIPFGGARNELANMFNPGMREVEKDIWSTIKNRNPGLRGTLPFKYDVLDGSILRDYDFPTRLANSISPIQLNTKDTPTRRLLRESGFDINYTLSTDTKGTKLNADQRSQMQNLVGKQNIESQLKELFVNPQIQRELAQYKKLRDLGIPDHAAEDSMPIKDSLVYNQIEGIFYRAKQNAEAQLRVDNPSLLSGGYAKQAVKSAQQAGKPDLGLLQLQNK